MSLETLFRSDEVIIRFERADSDTLLIAFGHLNTDPAGVPWAAELAKALGWSFMGVTPFRGSWFPAAGFAGLPASIMALSTAYRRRITYGGSMGGYGALKWSRMFGATMVIAGSPQFSIDPAYIATFDKRWNSHFDPALHRDIVINAEDIGADSFILVDPHLAEDMAQVRTIAALSDRVHILPAPSTGHGSLVGIAGTAVFRDFVDLLARRDVGAAHRIMTTYRRQTHARLSLIVINSWIRRPAIARKLLGRLEDIARPHLLAATYYDIGMIHEKRREFDDSLDYYRRAAAQDQGSKYINTVERVTRIMASLPKREALAILLDNLPDPHRAAPLPARTESAEPGSEPAGGTPNAETAPIVATDRSSRADVLPANVVINGDIEGNIVVVEPSDRHIAVVIEVRGRGNTVIVRRDCALDAILFASDGAHIEIGRQTSMLGVRITAHEGARCIVGARCMLSRNVQLRPSGAEKIFDTATRERINQPAPIVIGDEVWIDEYVYISRGCTIGANSVIRTASRLSGDYPDNAFIAGSPARVVRTAIKWTH